MKPLHYAMIAIVLFVGGIVAIGTLNRPHTQPAQRFTDSQLSDGKVLYAQYCATCHGANLAGQANWQTANANGSYPAPPHDESGHTWHHSDAYLLAVTLQGGAAVTGAATNAMPGFANQLSSAQAQAIIDYIKSTWPAETQAKQAQLNQ